MKTMQCSLRKNGFILSCFIALGFGILFSLSFSPRSGNQLKNSYKQLDIPFSSLENRAFIDLDEYYENLENKIRHSPGPVPLRRPQNWFFSFTTLNNSIYLSTDSRSFIYRPLTPLRI